MARQPRFGNWLIGRLPRGVTELMRCFPGNIMRQRLRALAARYPLHASWQFTRPRFSGWRTNSLTSETVDEIAAPR